MIAVSSRVSNRILYNYDEVPDLIKTLPRWVPWRYEYRYDKNENRKKTKVPIDLDLRPFDATIASGFEFDESHRLYLSHREENGKNAVDGLGICLGEAGGVKLAGIDTDKSLVNNSFARWAKEPIDFIKGYADVSPSGKGVKLFFRVGEDFLKDEVTPHKKYINKDQGTAIEFYHEKRFFTLTGIQLPGYDSDMPFQDQEALLWFRASFADEIAKRTKSERKAARESRELPNGGLPGADEEKVLEFMRKASNWPSIESLMNGVDPIGGRGDSEVDAALATHIGFYAGQNIDLIERIMRQSKLVREKWDSRRGHLNWIQYTIQNCLNRMDSFYQWREPRIDADRLIAEALKKSKQEQEPSGQPELVLVDPDEEPDIGFEDRPRKKNSMLEETSRLQALTPLQAWAQALKRPREPFIESHSTFGDITMLFGVAGGGKSELVKKIIMCSIFGEDFFGNRIKRAHHLYIDPENGQNTLFDLYTACGTHPQDIMEMPDPFSEEWDMVAARSEEFYEKIATHAASDDKLQALEQYLTIVSERPENFGPEALRGLLRQRREVIGDERLAVYLDPFRALHSHIEGYDENNANCVQPILDDYNRVAREFNVSLWILHHTVKSNNGKGVGSGAFYGAASNILIYERSPEDHGSPGILKVYRMRGQSPCAPIRIGMDTKTRKMFRMASGKDEKAVGDGILDRQHMNMIESFLKYDEDLNQSQITVKAKLKSIPKNRVPVLLGMLVEAGRASIGHGEKQAKLYRRSPREE